MFCYFVIHVVFDPFCSAMRSTRQIQSAEVRNCEHGYLFDIFDTQNYNFQPASSMTCFSTNNFSPTFVVSIVCSLAAAALENPVYRHRQQQQTEAAASSSLRFSDSWRLRATSQVSFFGISAETLSEKERLNLFGSTSRPAIRRLTEGTWKNEIRRQGKVETAKKSQGGKDIYLFLQNTD